MYIYERGGLGDDMARAHKADEWIGLDELESAHRMMERLVQKLGRPITEWMAPS